VAFHDESSIQRKEKFHLIEKQKQLSTDRIVSKAQISTGSREKASVQRFKQI
jgi:succinyl-CoA synthetase beta subunit